MGYMIVDIVIVLILIFFAWRGARKGLILTLFGMLGLVIALLGARFLSNTFFEPVSDIIQPGIYQSVKDLEEKALGGLDFELNETLDSSADSLIDILREQDLFPGLTDLLESAVEKDSVNSTSGLSAAETLSTYLAQLLARLILFVLGFIVILLLWFLISRALDLAFKLPILNVVNVVGGLILGLFKAIVIVVILVWVGQLLDLLPATPSTPILSLFTPSGIREILNHLVV